MTSGPRSVPAFVNTYASAGVEATHAVVPTHVRGDPTGIVAGVAVVGAILGVGKMWWDASSSPSSAAEPLEFEEIPQVEVVLFFSELTLEVKNLLCELREQKQLPEIENAVRQYLKENNQELSDAQFKQAILEQLYQMMEGLEHQAVAKRQWSRASLEYALEKYAQDPEVLKLQEDLNGVMRTVFPAPEPVDIPADLTAAKTLEILKEMVGGMEKAMSDMLAHARAEGITDAVKAMEEFQHLWLTDELMFVACRVQIFAAALQKYSGSEQFRQQVEQIYAKQAKAFQKMGLPVETQ
ncbi:hypothetical protein BBJ28_00023104 [Nothophytophthora sp. Chile5]|nr:hypothetical protein BBJ28_00023104 [Nothophytophthora sp. Chile5]